MFRYGSVTGASGLASTGIAVSIGGHFFGVFAILLTAFLMVALGALCLRLGWRRDRPLNGR
jgi:hypothetical protein